MKRWKRLRNRRGAECSSRLCTFQRQIKLTALPGIIGVGILYLIPGCALFYYALINNVFQKRFVGLENFTEILSNPYFRLALKNTIFLLGLFLFLTLFLIYKPHLRLREFLFSPARDPAGEKYREFHWKEC